MNQRRLHRRMTLTLAFFTFLWAWLAYVVPPHTAAESIEPTLTVYFFDVGQGDAVLFQADDFTLLIDAGRHDRSDVIPHLHSVGIETIDLFVGTHPHSDHIGQCEPVKIGRASCMEREARK